MTGDNEIAFVEHDSGHWAEIILPLALPTVYTYAIPAHLVKQAVIGCRAEVVFGKNKKYAGIIRSVTDKSPAYKTKPLLNILDDSPLIYEQQLSLWAWMSKY